MLDPHKNEPKKKIIKIVVQTWLAVLRQYSSKLPWYQADTDAASASHLLWYCHYYLKHELRCHRWYQWPTVWVWAGCSLSGCGCCCWRLPSHRVSRCLRFRSRLFDTGIAATLATLYPSRGPTSYSMGEKKKRKKEEKVSCPSYVDRMRRQGSGSKGGGRTQWSFCFWLENKESKKAGKAGRRSVYYPASRAFGWCSALLNIFFLRVLLYFLFFCEELYISIFMYVFCSSLWLGTPHAVDMCNWHGWRCFNSNAIPLSTVTGFLKIRITM